MTILVIDAGNSRIKWGVADENGWLRRASLATAEAASFGEALKDVPVPSRIVVSNVAGARVRDALAAALTAAFAQAFANHPVAPLWVSGCDQQCGVRSGYADPAQLGSDRWAALIAAWRIYGRACVVVNAGTTMTVDALSGEGVFLGGVIVPGLDLMRASLDNGTAQLKWQPGAFYYFPDNTADAITSGALNALAGAIDRMRRYMEESGQRNDNGGPLVVLSGGAAALIQPRLNEKAELVDNLVLEGLLEIAKQP
ncbi:MAG: type III pantothenate kinase [Burkholderiales bacterium]